jgi:hypothetical protein
MERQAVMEGDASCRYYTRHFTPGIRRNDGRNPSTLTEAPLFVKVSLFKQTPPMAPGYEPETACLLCTVVKGDDRRKHLFSACGLPVLLILVPANSSNFDIIGSRRTLVRDFPDQMIFPEIYGFCSKQPCCRPPYCW